MADGPAVRNAATVILVRDAVEAPKILMGRRSPKAAFMPSAYVFPGGAVDPGDAQVELATPLPAPCVDALRSDSAGVTAEALALAGLREVFEETGLIIGTPSRWANPPAPWREFAACGYRPGAAPLSFVFRAITPPGRPRRFDARFFLADAAAIVGDCEDFSRASDELSDLAWLPLEAARQVGSSFITQVVLAEVAARLPDLGAPEAVPFFRNNDEDSLFLRLGGNARNYAVGQSKA